MNTDAILKNRDKADFNLTVHYSVWSKRELAQEYADKFIAYRITQPDQIEFGDTFDVSIDVMQIHDERTAP